MGFVIKGYNDDKQTSVTSVKVNALDDLDAFNTVDRKKQVIDDIKPATKTVINNIIEKKLVDNTNEDNCDDAIYKNDKDDYKCSENEIKSNKDGHKDCKGSIDSNGDTISLFDYVCKIAADIDMKKMYIVCKDGYSLISEKSARIKPFIGKAKYFFKNKAQCRISAIQDFGIKYQFRNGTVIKGRDFTFILNDNNELMLKSYTGVSCDVNIPDVVKGFKVCYITSGFLSGRKLLGTINSVSSEHLASCDIDSVLNNVRGVTSVRLPLYLKKLPKKCFLGCSEMDKLFIPPNVLAVDPKAFSKVAIKEIVFEGKCPRGLNYAVIDKDTKVFCSKKFSNTFSYIDRFKINVI